MNVDKLREELEIDEGVRYHVYLSHLGYPTFGIGHLIRADDPEAGCDIGTPINKDRVIEAFNADVEQVVGDCQKLYSDFEELPEEAQIGESRTVNAD